MRIEPFGRYTSVGRRIALCLGLGLLAGLIAQPGDFAFLWWSAHEWRAGLDPYTVVGPEPWRIFQWPWHQLYPLPAILVVVPFSFLPLPLAASVFVGLSVAGLTWTLTRERLADPRLWLLASTAMLSVLTQAQWTPGLMAAALTPSLGWLLIAKPQTGLALFVAYPSWRAAIGCAVFLLATVAIWPWWVPEWLSLIRSSSAHMTAPIMVPGGFLLALAALRWRRPEARLLLAMALIPHTHARYELLPLFLIVQSWRDGAILSLGTVLVYGIALASPSRDLDAMYALNAQLMTWCVYLPCLAMILWRRDPVPVIVEHCDADGVHAGPPQWA